VGTEVTIPATIIVFVEMYNLIVLLYLIFHYCYKIRNV